MPNRQVTTLRWHPNEICVTVQMSARLFLSTSHKCSDLQVCLRGSIVVCVMLIALARSLTHSVKM